MTQLTKERMRKISVESASPPAVEVTTSTDVNTYETEDSKDLPSLSSKREQGFLPIPFFRRINTHPNFSLLCILLIFVNALGASISCQNRTNASDIFGVVMTTLFGVTLFVKFLGSGLDFFRDSWNLLQMFLVFMAIIGDISRKGNGHYILVIMFFRLLKVLTMIRSLENVRISIHAVVASMSVLGNFAITLLVFIYPTAIMLTVYIGQNSSLSHKETDEGTKNIELWGTLPRSMLSLFQIATLDWGDIVRASVMDEPLLAIIFICFILATGFAVSNVFITIIGEKYSNLNQMAEDEDAYHEGKEELEEMEKKKAALLESVRQGHISHANVNFDTVRRIEFTNSDIACMILSLQQQLHAQQTQIPTNKAMSEPALNT